jgi:hypothetical protein
MQRAKTPQTQSSALGMNVCVLLDRNQISNYDKLIVPEVYCGGVTMFSAFAYYV